MIKAVWKGWFYDTVEFFKNEAPEVFDAYFNVIETLSKRYQLEPKKMELVLLAVLTAKESETGMPVHIDRTLKAGATKYFKTINYKVYNPIPY